MNLMFMYYQVIRSPINKITELELVAAPEVARVLISQTRHMMYIMMQLTFDLYVMLHPVYP